MLHFSKLKLSGFKSFVEQTELEINLGLTGVVGPNGCGKSNLVEALKWVMGETSPKQMRGGEMEEVIFSGTQTRPARNFAEVTLSLDNSARRAPSQFNSLDEVDVNRRIERDKGSIYRVNGVEVRARDVYLLFADQATGARSTALVGQGRIGAIISAKPQDRRILLEEAAGIRGLHARRHETELRLKGAETNLHRLDDIIITLDTQRVGIKKQARQATRYRNLSSHIRKAEATLLYVRWTAAKNILSTQQDENKKAEEIVVELSRIVGNMSSRQLNEAEKLPELRQKEAEEASKFQRFQLALENLDAENNRAELERADCQELLSQLVNDQAQEEKIAEEAAASIERLTHERENISISLESEKRALEKQTELLEQCNLKTRELEVKQNSLTKEVADAEGQKIILEQRESELEGMLARLSCRKEEINRERYELKQSCPESSAIESASGEVGKLEIEVSGAQNISENSEAAQMACADSLENARRNLQDSLSSFSRLEAETAALEKILHSEEQENWPMLADQISVDPGYEVALGTALGEDLNASINSEAPMHWRTFDVIEENVSLPSGVRALAEKINGPPALSRRLAQIGIVDSKSQGDMMAGQLKQGQRLVTPEGDLWRWDGFIVTAEASTVTSVRFEQKNRLRETKDQLKHARKELEQAEMLAKTMREKLRLADVKAQESRESYAQKIANLEETRRNYGELKERATSHASMLVSLDNQFENITNDYLESEKKLVDTRAKLLGITDNSEVRKSLQELASALQEKQLEAQKNRDVCEGLQLQFQRKSERFKVIEAELTLWSKRSDEAKRKQDELYNRLQEIEARYKRLSLIPGEIKKKNKSLLESIQLAEDDRKVAADNLVEAEKRLSDCNKKLRDAELSLSEAREKKIRAEGALEQAAVVCESISERVGERLDCELEELLEIAGLKEGEVIPELEIAERKVERLLRERDTMGPVNLRADQEMIELETQIESLNLEKDDLIEAIKKLRRGIAELNREGRDRLLESFNAVNEHFKKIFVKLFGGGHAYLALTESEDPLEAGLEIMASPPGKKLQNLTLLSGGEQALTALAMIFGVFLTNPAPICVLDEVDAPLDDANVNRFCSMLEEVAKNKNTRFLIITHNRITMARMNRLFGVTMSEQGVSQLVSVDLQRAQDLRDAG